MGIQRLFIIGFLVVGLIVGYYAVSPKGKYHKPDCFWVKVFTEKDSSDFPSGTFYVAIYKSRTGDKGTQFVTYSASNRTDINLTNLDRCLWCRPTKP